MIATAFLFVRVVCDRFKSRRRLEAEILVLRHQFNVLQQRALRQLYLSWADRALFVWLYRGFPRILYAITIVWPETVVRLHRMGFAAYWRWKSRPLGGRPQSGLFRAMLKLPVARAIIMGSHYGYAFGRLVARRATHSMRPRDASAHLITGLICSKRSSQSLCVPKIRFCNIGGEGHRELGVT
jgi:hypothetical protein